MGRAHPFHLLTPLLVGFLLFPACYWEVAPRSEDARPNTTTDADAYEMEGFSFVRDYLAGMPRPGVKVSLDTDLDYMKSQGITVLVSLTEDSAEAADLEERDIELLHLPVVDFHAPTQEQMLKFIARTRLTAAQGAKVGVHCAAGKGRTGTFLAAWAISEGSSAQAAIAEIRAARPGSIETAAQESALAELEAYYATEAGRENH